MTCGSQRDPPRVVSFHINALPPAWFEVRVDDFWGPASLRRDAVKSARRLEALLSGVAHYLFNSVEGHAGGSALHECARGWLEAEMWGIDADEPHRDALAAGDLALIFLGAPQRVFIGCAQIASAVHDWTPSEAQVYPGDLSSGVLLTLVEQWDPPVPMNTVLSRIDRSGGARADFQQSIVRVTANEYETALAVATEPGRTAMR